MQTNSSLKVPLLPPKEKPANIPDVVDLDRDNAFMLYAIFCGDSIRTAHALNTKPEIVAAISLQDGWDKKLEPIINLNKSAKPGDVERAVNRAMNFVQAHKCRMFFERVLNQMCGMTVPELEAFLFPKTGKRGSDEVIVEQRFTTRSLADMASALEKCHMMTYMALGDSSTERKERGSDEGSDATTAHVHLRLANAMAASGAKLAKGLVQTKLEEGQAEMAREHSVIDATSGVTPADTRNPKV